MNSGPAMQLGLGSFSRTRHLACSITAGRQGHQVGLVAVSYYNSIVFTIHLI